MMNKANIMITNNCNLRCLHCYIDAKSCKENYHEIYINAKQLILKLHNDGINNIMFTGGECMIFPYLKELIIHAKSLKVKTTIFTNGMIFDSSIFDLVDYVNLSIDGNKETHNYIRQNAKSYDNILRVLKYLKKIDKKTSIQMTINDLNINQLDDIVEIGLKHLNIRNIKLVFTSNIGRAKFNNINNNENNIESVLNKLDLLYKKTKYHIQFLPNIISEYDFDNYYKNKKMPFAVWFDVPNNEYYLFSKAFFKDKISNYNYNLIDKKNQEILKFIKKNSEIIKSYKYICLEDILNTLIKGENNE